MPAALIVQLLATFGPSAIELITTLIKNIQTQTSVTPDQWAALVTNLQKSARDQMMARIVAAGIDPASPQGVSLLALSQ